MEVDTPTVLNASEEGEIKPTPAAATETEAGAEISALVNYVQPVHFSSFENAKSKSNQHQNFSVIKYLPFREKS